MNRGGSWANDAENCRSAYRNWNEPANRNENLGFRVAAAAPRKRRMPSRAEQTAVRSRPSGRAKSRLGAAPCW